MNITWVKFPEDLSPAYYIRTRVFVQEQNCPEEIEFDDIDRKAQHIVLMDDGENPLATARIFEDSRGQAIIGRVAVLKEHRGKGYGKVVVKEAMKRLENLGYPTILIHGQTYAVPFYEKLGFRAFGEEFIEDGLPHIGMEYWCNQ